MIMVQKNVVMDWLKRHVCKDRLHERKQYNHNYHKYETIDIVEHDIEHVSILSVFTLEEHGHQLFVMFVNSSIKCNIIGISMIIEENGRRDCGFKYMKYEIYKREKIVEDVEVEGMESNMVCYCLMLPFVYSEEDFNQNFAIIYDIWQVGNKLDRSEVLCICELLFLQDVLLM